jgi:alkanesulfonate monooxygenase SsuD/methylene tetrahydromethanopterin reductase-like flavin-dependent oxidoreductase (luciferase family)
MKLVFTCGIRTLPGAGQDLAALYRAHLDEAVLAEELGFDCVWVSEHHFSPDAWNPSPFTFLAAVAARSDRVRLGTYVLLLPLHNPLRIAEDVAVLDNISGGRVDLGVGVGSSPEEFRTFGVPIEGRLGRTFEALRIIERCFAGEPFSHHGKYYDFPDVQMTTTPVQRPGPPILVAAMGEQSVSWTARRGYHMAAGAGRGHDRYLAALREHGHDPATKQIASVPIRVHVADAASGRGTMSKRGCTRCSISTAPTATRRPAAAAPSRSARCRQSASSGMSTASGMAASHLRSEHRTTCCGCSATIAAGN